MTHRHLFGDALPLALPRVFTREGFPWDPNRTVYHATTGLRSILKHGFKTRKDIGRHATGGGTEHAVSLTLDPRVAVAIALGLDTIRRIVQGQLQWVELYERMKSECPQATVEGMKYMRLAERDVYQYLHMGYRPVSYMDAPFEWKQPLLNPHGGFTLPEWVLFDQEEGRWWVPAAKHPSKSDSAAWYLLGGDMSDFYRQTLPFGEMYKECYDPFFMSTTLEAFKDTRPEDIGVVEVRADVRRVCSDARGAVQMGYLTRDEAQRWAYFLSDEQNECEREVDRRAQGEEPYVSSRVMRLPEFAKSGWQLVNEGRRVPDTTGVYFSSMAELRVYAPKRIEVQNYLEMDDLREGAQLISETRLRDGVGQRITHPYFLVME